MDRVKVNRVDLIAKVRANLADHRAVFEEAQINYRKAVIEELDKMLTEARQGREIRRTVKLIEPKDHSKDYQYAIEMLEMSVDKDVEIEEHHFRQYVKDDWGWKGQWTASNDPYVISASNRDKLQS